MPFIRSLISKYPAHTVAIILLLGEVIPSYSHYKEKKLVYIIIIALFSYQFSFYIKCTKSNMRLSCNIKLVSNAKYIWFAYFIIF